MIDLIKETIKSKEFKNEINDYLQYATNIKIEKFIAYSFNKSFLKKGRNSILEKKKVDIVTDGLNIELKFHFDFDIIQRFEQELKNSKDNLITLFEKSTEAKGKHWLVAHEVLKDILKKIATFSFGLFLREIFLHTHKF